MMFAERAPRLELNDSERKIYEELFNDPTTTCNDLRSWAIVPRPQVDAAIKRERLLWEPYFPLQIPEYQLVNHTKYWHELTIAELDYFASKLLGKEPLIAPIDPTNRASNLHCINKHTGSMLSPCRDWDLAQELMEQYRVVITRERKQHILKTWGIKHPRRYNCYHGERLGFTLMRTSICELITALALAREEPYTIDYGEQAYIGADNAPALYPRHSRNDGRRAKRYARTTAKAQKTIAEKGGLASFRKKRSPHKQKKFKPANYT